MFITCCQTCHQSFDSCIFFCSCLLISFQIHTDRSLHTTRKEISKNARRSKAKSFELSGSRKFCFNNGRYLDRSHHEKFFGVTVHLTKSTSPGDRELVSLLLHFKEFSTAHTGENIAIAIEDALEENSLLEINIILDNVGKERISCFAHSLQLVIGDGLKEARCVGTARSKISRITLLHRSTAFKMR